MRVWVYIATTKGDPKTLEMRDRPTVSVLALDRRGEVPNWSETEVRGRPETLEPGPEQAEARRLLVERSPVVRHLVQAGQDHVLDYIAVRPREARHRVFGEIMRGLPPTVIRFEEARPALGADLAALRARLGTWLVATRAPFLVATAAPVLLGAAVAWKLTGRFHGGLFAATLAAATFLHLAANLFNDYFDHLSGADAENREFVRPFTGGSRVIQSGALPAHAILALGTAALAAGTASGVFLAATAGWWVWALGGAGVLAAVFYTAPPVALAARGLGEATVGLAFGPGMALGAYAVQTGEVSWVPVVAALPLGLAIAMVLWVNEIPDAPADERAGKRTLVVRLGRRSAARVHAALVAAAAAAVVVPVLAGAAPAGSLLGLAGWVVIASGVPVALRHFASPPDLAPACGATAIGHAILGLGLAVGWALAGWPLAAVAAGIGAAGLPVLAWHTHRVRGLESARRSL